MRWCPGLGWIGGLETEMQAARNRGRLLSMAAYDPWPKNRDLYPIRGTRLRAES